MPGSKKSNDKHKYVEKSLEYYQNALKQSIKLQSSADRGLEKAEKKLNETDIELKKTKSELSKHRKNHHSYKNKFKKTETELKKTKLALQTANGKITVLKHKSDTANQNLSLAKDKIAKLEHEASILRAKLENKDKPTKETENADKSEALNNAESKDSAPKSEPQNSEYGLLNPYRWAGFKPPSEEPAAPSRFDILDKITKTNIEKARNDNPVSKAMKP